MKGEHPVAVLGAGPVGLAASARLHELGIAHVVLEGGEAAASHVREWGHVRMFTSWKWNIDPVARRLLETTGWKAPEDDRYPTGGDLCRLYLEPLGRMLSPYIRLGHRVVSVGKTGFDRARNGGRNEAPFEVRFVARGLPGALTARAVLDATGTWSTPNPLGAGGYPALGEAEFSSRIFRGVPDVLGRDRAKLAGRRVLVVGSGDSALTALSDLARLAEEEPRTKILWAFRGGSPPTSGRRPSPFPSCIALLENVRELVSARRVEVAPGLEIEALESEGTTLRVRGRDRVVDGIDVIVAATGFRPDQGLARELRLDIDPSSESVAGIAPLIEGARGSCRTPRRHGVAELSHPDPAYFIVGIKSYGRAPSFLLETGYVQIARVVELLQAPVPA